MNYKQGDLVKWLVGGLPGEYDFAVVVDTNPAGVLIIFQVWGTGPFHLATVPEGLTAADLPRIVPVSRELTAREREGYTNLLTLAHLFREVRE